MTSSRKYIHLILMLALVVAFMIVYSARLSSIIDPTATTEALSLMRRRTQANNQTKRCIFEDSELYRSVYVYPSPDEPEWKISALVNEFGKSFNETSWPWIEFDNSARENERWSYNMNGTRVQYGTELLVRELMVNPDSCLRTNDPESATLFYVPYLPSIEMRRGLDDGKDRTTSPYGQSIMDIVEKNDYSLWERKFGLSSDYWKRRSGGDHILVFSEPLEGLKRPRYPRRPKRGNFHFIESQKQLNPPIVISIELSKTFVDMYPSCARKNILAPYPNTHGSWFNGDFRNQAAMKLKSSNVTESNKQSALSGGNTFGHERPITQYYSAGSHGTCKNVRVALKQDYESCSESYHGLRKLEATHYNLGMQLSTFCPCPGGDSPSAKRMFDSVVGGAIPVVLSEDFVWPFTNEFDKELELDPSEFSIRLNASDYDMPLLDEKSCHPLDSKRPGMQFELASVSADEIARLQRGVRKVRDLYSWYSFRSDLPENPLRERILPDGGAAHFIVQELEKRAMGKRWPACQQELLNSPKRDEPRQFKC